VIRNRFGLRTCVEVRQPEMECVDGIYSPDDCDYSTDPHKEVVAVPVVQLVLHRWLYQRS
jgi:hypothetical protein